HEMVAFDLPYPRRAGAASGTPVLPGEARCFRRGYGTVLGGFLHDVRLPGRGAADLRESRCIILGLAHRSHLRPLFWDSLRPGQWLSAWSAEGVSARDRGHDLHRVQRGWMLAGLHALVRDRHAFAWDRREDRDSLPLGDCGDGWDYRRDSGTDHRCVHQAEDTGGVHAEETVGNGCNGFAGAGPGTAIADQSAFLFQHAEYDFGAGGGRPGGGAGDGRAAFGSVPLYARMYVLGCGDAWRRGAVRARLSFD